MADAPLLCVHKLRRSVNSSQLWSDISVDVYPGEIWFIRGPSGVGKTLFLRAVSCLDPLEAGVVKLKGQTPSQVGMTCWRANVAYVHQSRVNFKGTPMDLLNTAQQFCSQRGRPRGDIHALVEDLGLQVSMLQQQWTELSGGQAQRMHLAIALALKPQVLLLDEPTSACDYQAALRVEAVLKNSSAAILWVTHDPAQPERVGGKTLELPSGTMSAVAPKISTTAGSCPNCLAAGPVDGAAREEDRDSSSSSLTGLQQEQ
eukprot:GHUV01000854.1.p1 GENE.GHUV01000854.1~~GHUV01000854.1.p1  ORF type:complete len:259 (+),score=82.44 GHUV01000854.1:175-951(+)